MTTPDRNIVPMEAMLHRPFDRRGFLRGTGRTALGVDLLGGRGGFAAACIDNGGSGGGDTTDRSDSGGGDFSGVSSPLKIGVIIPTSGIGKFIGDIVGRSLGATKQRIEKAGLPKGVTVEYEIVNAPAEQLERMAQIVDEGWGSQRTKRSPAATGDQIAMSNDCRIH